MSILPYDAKSQAVRAGCANSWPVLPDPMTWWPSRAMTKADYQRIDRHVRNHERGCDYDLCLSLHSAALLGLDSDDLFLRSNGESAFFDTEEVRRRLDGWAGLEILDFVGAQ